MQPVAEIRVVMLANGSIQAAFNGKAMSLAPRDLFNLMLSRAQQDLVPKLMEQEKHAEGVEIPPPGFLAPGRN